MDNNLFFKILEITENFNVEGELIFAEAYGCGHINDTYAAYFSCGDKKVRYTVQRINHLVFKNPIDVIENIAKVTNHLREKIIKNGGDPKRETLSLISTKSGNDYYADKTGDFWRIYEFVDDACTYQTATPEIFEESAKGFGRFQSLLSDFDASLLVESIPDFHNTVKRFEAFEKAIERNAAGRADSVKEEIEFFKDRKNDMAVLVNLLEKNELPLRVTHNDTKLNNVLIDNKTKKAICVIDLDTVMPGLSLYDFGDSIRFGASSAEEDERNLDLVYLDLDKFEAYTRGYLSQAGEAMTQKEIENLALSSKILTLECGMRFLTDYLDGDVYFKTHREGHNLDRCRTHIKLVKDMEEKMEQMNKIVEKYTNKRSK
ncbi:MAG: aminoglycoside phosphotransferase family protein [Ruminococcaceae bacterium]|nr:aminoglycoside phosphotransferase family protein [Oscillospiraceae bacterium]